jgi:hypothetical protein
MNSWWELGETAGYSGDHMDPTRLTCPFCSEKGHFSLAHHAEKKKANTNYKRLNFDLYQCHNCVGYVQVLWSSNGSPPNWAWYDYRVLPSPLQGKPEPSQNWPDGMKRFWIQAHDSLRNENWDAANVMARSALQFVVRERGAQKGNLKEQIDNLAVNGTLNPMMREWAHEVRLLANESAHPDAPMPQAVTSQDVSDIVNFLDFLLLYLYDLPQQVNMYRQRKNAVTNIP